MKTTQVQDGGDITNEGGTAPGGITAFVGGAAQYNQTSVRAQANEPPGGKISPVQAASIMHTGLRDQAPDGSGNVPIHPGLMPGLFRTASDANPVAPDGENRGGNPEIVANPQNDYAS